MDKYNLLSIIVPALNEADTLEELYRRTNKALEPDQKFEFIVIDDGSVDNTFEVLEDLHREYSNIIAVRHCRNLGKSMALMQGFDIARGDVAIMMDADLQDQPEHIPQFLAKLEEGYDLVNGWRVNRRDKNSKKAVSYIYNFLTRFILKCPLYDINCGYKAMRKKVYKNLGLRGDFHRLIPALAMENGFRITEIPVEHAERVKGKSKFPLLRYLGLLDIFAARFGKNRPWRSFHAFFRISLTFWIIALVCLLFWLGIKISFLKEMPFNGILSTMIAVIGIWALSLATFLPLAGLQLDILTRGTQARSWREKKVSDIIGIEEICIRSDMLERDILKNPGRSDEPDL